MKKRMIVIVATLVVIGFTLVPFKAMADEGVVTNCPSGWNADANVNYAYDTTTRNGVSAEMDASYSQWIYTGAYTNPDYSPYIWPSQPLPPDDVNISFVNLVAYVKGPAYPTIRNFALEYTINGPYAEDWALADIAQFFTDGTGTWQELRSNATSYETWTPSLVKSWDTYVRMSSDDTYGSLLIDYIGLEYGWYAPNVSLPGGSSNLSVSPISVTGIFGTVGFIGMVAIPGAAIWFYRRDGGSKIEAGVMALVAFILCFGLFLASIGA
jgi:hypothetical protein